jgi:hypothetical protein
MSGRRFEIRTTRSSKEWSEWCSEKSTDAVRLIARALSVARRGDPSAEVAGDLEFYLRLALSDVKKLLEFSRGETASGQFPELIAGPRDDDYEQILFELQLIAETRRMREQRELLESQEKPVPELVEK